MRTRRRLYGWIGKMAFGGMLALGAVAADAQPSGGALRATARIGIQVVIPAIVRVKAFMQPAAFEVSARDIARGYAELDDASSLLLTSNSRNGYQLTVAFDTSLLAAVEVKLASERHAVRSSQESLRIEAPRTIDAPVRIGYRLFLNREVVPGVYPWPVNLGFSVAGA